VSHWWWGFTRWQFHLTNGDHETWIATLQLVVLVAILVAVIVR
jgi:hypothetical protein